mmetsp:Transcript_2907/g.10195  ORF Transcript_2907/g.10195 Transcript_2907/m.10195 type:complete len:222 (-) Transcript_2907:31-696(-)
MAPAAAPSHPSEAGGGCLQRNDQRPSRHCDGNGAGEICGDEGRGRAAAAPCIRSCGQCAGEEQRARPPEPVRLRVPRHPHRHSRTRPRTCECEGTNGRHEGVAGRHALQLPLHPLYGRHCGAHWPQDRHRILLQPLQPRIHQRARPRHEGGLCWRAGARDVLLRAPSGQPRPRHLHLQLRWRHQHWRQLRRHARERARPPPRVLPPCIRRPRPGSRRPRET